MMRANEDDEVLWWEVMQSRYRYLTKNKEQANKSEKLCKRQRKRRRICESGRGCKTRAVDM
jgi:hypothetical protein